MIAYTEQIVAEMTDSLATVEKDVNSALLRYKSVGSLQDKKLVAMKELERLQSGIAETMARLKKEQTLRTKKATRAAFRMGVYDGIDEFAAAQLPFYKDLTPEGIDKLAGTEGIVGLPIEFFRISTSVIWPKKSLPIEMNQV